MFLEIVAFIFIIACQPGIYAAITFLRSVMPKRCDQIPVIYHAIQQPGSCSLTVRRCSFNGSGDHIGSFVMSDNNFSRCYRQAFDPNIIITNISIRLYHLDYKLTK